MANRRDDRFDERQRWRDNPYRSNTGEWRGENDYDPARYGRSHEPEYYGERRYAGYRHEQPESQRHRNQEPWSYRDDYGRYAGERHYGPHYGNTGEQYRDRPYSGSTSYSGRGGFGAGYENEHEPYTEGREGYGATSVGAGWGSVDTGRHRLGSLTDSAANSAQHMIRQQYGREYPQRTSYAGRGPKGYKRSDDRIREDVSEVLTRSHDVDASNIEVTVNDGIVVLSGTVDDRHAKRMAEDLAQDVSGVRDVENQIRVQPSSTNTTHENQRQGTSETARTAGSGGVLGLSAEAGSRR
jgi:osmotically-inducible protein OsmY